MVKIKPPGYGPRVLAHASICQGKPFRHFGVALFVVLTRIYVRVLLDAGPDSSGLKFDLTADTQCVSPLEKITVVIDSL